MLDIAPTELMLVALVAIIIIGPKDLPKAMRFAGHWIGKARSVARQFRAGFDSIVQEAELAEMEKKWNDENARIMREHPAKALMSSDDKKGGDKDDKDDGKVHDAAGPPDGDEPVMVEKPVITDGDEEPVKTEPEQQPAGNQKPKSAADSAGKDDSKQSDPPA